MVFQKGTDNLLRESKNKNSEVVVMMTIVLDLKQRQAESHTTYMYDRGKKKKKKKNQNKSMIDTECFTYPPHCRLSPGTGWKYTIPTDEERYVSNY